jgi:hypothetical protein
VFRAEHLKHGVHGTSGQNLVTQGGSISGDVSKSPAGLLAKTRARRGHHANELGGGSLSDQVLGVLVLSGGNVGQGPKRHVLLSKGGHAQCHHIESKVVC